LSEGELQILHVIGTDSMNPEQLLAFAQQKARENRYEMVRLICKKALLSSPNYEDMRLLMGRTYLWQGDFETARKYFEESRKRTPNSGQPWKALIEVEMKTKNYQKAIELSDEAYRQFQNPDFIVLKEEAIKAKSK
jgi:lipoteichoic acid synthase